MPITIFETYKQKIYDFIAKFTSMHNAVITVMANHYIFSPGSGNWRVDDYTKNSAVSGLDYTATNLTIPAVARISVSLPHSINYVIINTKGQAASVGGCILNIFINNKQVMTNYAIPHLSNNLIIIAPIQLYSGMIDFTDHLNIDIQVKSGLFIFSSTDIVFPNLLPKIGS